VAFDKCPYQYKLAHILKIPIKGKASFSFGKTLHNTLDDFLRAYFQTADKTQESLFGFPFQEKKEGQAFLFDELVEIYEKNWIGEWYESKAQKQEYKKLGREVLKNFYEDFIKNPPKILKINNELALETSFHLKAGEYTLIGKIDRIDEIDGGPPSHEASAGRRVCLIDYKTGKKKEKLEKDDKTQLLLYQIAAEEYLKLNPKELAYYYLESGDKITFLGSEAEKQRLRDEIVQTIEKIYKSNFKATPGFHCQFCDFKDICQFTNNEGE
jgi:DNA helicase-2/ATP-dependent DNA helicase PcrA